MDSLGLLTDLSPYTILQIAKLVNTNKSFFAVQKLSVLQQTETSDCGLFAITLAVETFFIKNVELVSFKQVAMHEHLYRCLESGEITSFPKIDSNFLLHSINQTLKINFYCICKLPDFFDDEMVQCDCCKHWYHSKCVSVLNISFWKSIQCLES